MCILILLQHIGDVGGLSPQDLTMFQLLERMRTGQLTSGTLRPYSWLDLATQPKPEQQIKIERFFESCSFKSVISYVMGMSDTIVVLQILSRLHMTI